MMKRKRGRERESDMLSEPTANSDCVKLISAPQRDESLCFVFSAVSDLIDGGRDVGNASLTKLGLRTNQSS